jgi:restriction system protein
MAGPQFVRYMVPVMEALQELGNSGTPSEVRDIVAKNLKLSDEVLDAQLKSGESRFVNQIHWAKFYLAKCGLVVSSERGVWTLTDKALKSPITQSDALELFKQVHTQWGKKQSAETPELRPGQQDENEELAPSDSGPPPMGDYRVELLNILKSLPPDGFERLCQRLLRESGFQQVEVTGKTGDGGIDGKGILQINPLMSIYAVFQAKRYDGTVGSPDITRFRGAMSGRTDKGIFITTGTFSTSAKKEATREGAPPIELVDADKLISMFERLELGLKPKTIYEIDEDFFDDFQ